MEGILHGLNTDALSQLRGHQPLDVVTKGLTRLIAVLSRVDDVTCDQLLLLAQRRRNILHTHTVTKNIHICASHMRTNARPDPFLVMTS